MFEVNDQHSKLPKFLRAKRPRILAVVGADLDIELCSSLTTGDKVLMEINGARTVSGQPNPLVAEEPWAVVSNDCQRGDKQGVMSGHLVLRHPSRTDQFSLSYRQIMRTGRGQPAVFVESNEAIQSGTLFVILQLVSFYAAENVIAELYPPISPSDLEEFQIALDDDRVKMGLLEDWCRAFKRLPEGWGYNGDKRFALRANVPVAYIKALRTEDYNKLLTITDEELTRMRRECHWMPYLMRQNELTGGIDAEGEYSKPGCV